MEQRQDPLATGRELTADEIEVRMLPRAALLPGIRAMAAEMALRADHDLDSVGDLRLAIEEACSTMATNANPEHTMTCRLVVQPNRVEVTMNVTLPGRRPTVSQLSLTILRVLCDTVDYWTTTAGEHVLFHVHLVRTVPRTPPAESTVDPR